MTDGKEDNITHVLDLNSKKLYEVSPNEPTRPLLPTPMKCGRCKKEWRSCDEYIIHKCEPTLYTCDFCQRPYRRIKLLSKHIEKHLSPETSGNRYTCNECEASYSSLRPLRIHILQAHQGIEHRCLHCSLLFPSENSFRVHKCRRDRQVVCIFCGERFKRSYLLKKHYRVTHPGSIQSCPYCHVMFRRKPAYIEHISKLDCSVRARKQWLENTENACLVCNKAFGSPHEFFEHFKGHPGLPYSCKWCPEQLESFADLAHHLKRNNYHHLHACDKCGRSFGSKEGLRRHIIKQHKSFVHFCELCQSGFVALRALKRHQSLQKCHKKIKEMKLRKQYFCQECQRSFTSGKALEQHPCRKKHKRQFNWSSKFIVTNVRGSGTDNQLRPLTDDDFFGTSDNEEDEKRGWFTEYYKAKEPEQVTSSIAFDNKVEQADPVEADEIGEIDARGDDHLSDKSAEDSSGDSDGQIEIDVINFDEKRCRICRRRFELEYELIHHFIKMHPNEVPHQCPECEVRLPLYAQLKEHMKNHGIGLGVYYCGLCSRTFKNKARAERHSDVCLTGSDWCGPKDCKSCGKTFQTKYGYKRHKPRCKKEIPARSSRKNKVSRGRNEPVEVFPEESTNIEPDGSDSDESTGLKIDDEDVNNGRMLQSSRVETPASPSLDIPRDTPSTKQGTSEAQEKADENHEKQVKEEKSRILVDPRRFPCRLCDASFPFERGLVMHFKEKHPGLKPLLCPQCNVELSAKLKEHLKTHGIGEEFVCALCSKRFNQKFQSKIHEMWHQGIEYKCELCKQKFLNAEKRNAHVEGGKCRERDSEFGITCETCGRSFKSRYGLKVHSVAHLPKEQAQAKNKFMCEFCNKWFVSRDSLARHTRIHTGEKPYRCSFCPKAFAQAGNCRAHEKIHMGQGKGRRRGGPEPAPQPIAASEETLYYVCTVREGDVIQIHEQVDIMHLYNLILVLTSIQSVAESSRIVFPDEKSRQRGDTPREIPLDLALRLSAVEDVEDLLTNFIDDDSKPPVFEARIGDRKSLKSAKMASCRPENTTVSLTPANTDSSIYYYPPCTRVARCGGCCSHDLLACQPVEVEILRLSVVVTEYRGGETLAFRSREVVHVEQHNKCKCDCKIKESDCAPYQRYNRNACRCECENSEEELMCNEESSKLWSSEECACVCRDTVDCASGYFFDRYTCGCVEEYQQKGRFVPFRHLNPNFN